MPVGAIIGGSAISAGASIVSGNKAAKASKQAADQSVAESRRQYDTDRADLAPWRSVGSSALGRLAREYGLARNTGDVPDGGEGSFTTSPGYQFRMSEGIRAQERSAASRGLLRSGAAVKAIQRYGEGLAASEYDAYWNRLAGLANVGQAATNTGIASGQATTANNMRAIMSAGDTRASSYLNTGSAIGQGFGSAVQAYLYNQGRFGGFGKGK